jgi:hypothetical protein
MTKVIAALVLSAFALAGCADTDADDRETPSERTTPAPEHHAPLKSGLHPDASDALRALGVSADQITQTIGHASASAGTHEKDGEVEGVDYSAATDISIRGKSEREIKTFLDELGAAGFAAWYRKDGADGWSGANHIHAVWAGCSMKASLRKQVRSWLDGRNGLVSNSTYKFYAWPESSKDVVRVSFVAHNPASS